MGVVPYPEVTDFPAFIAAFHMPFGSGAERTSVIGCEPEILRRENMAY
jgi:hypothetical protein